jgi:ADP-ribose pyrophosphatase YjhB (NUDIX family)
MRISFFASLLILLAACSTEQAPPCNFEGAPDQSPSAGCLVVHDGDLLLVKNQQNKFGPPGGMVDSGESSQCAAERETFEETGVEVVAREQFRQFANGFRLYWCEPVSPAPTPRILQRLEIREVGFYPPSEFDALVWRFPEQAEMYVDALRSVSQSP